MAGPLKATTGLAGLAVQQYPHRMLTAVYQKILKTIKDMPEDYAYRKNTQVTQKSLIGLFQCLSCSAVQSNSVGLAPRKVTGRFPNRTFPVGRHIINVTNRQC